MLDKKERSRKTLRISTAKYVMYIYNMSTDDPETDQITNNSKQEHTIVMHVVYVKH